jgi:hypothetical protein
VPPATVFLSDSHKDEVWKKRLAMHLGRLAVRRGFSTSGMTGRSKAGAEWLREIEAVIQKAEVAILLISADFLTSPFIRQHEIPELLERRSRNGLPVEAIVPLLQEVAAAVSKRSCGRLRRGSRRSGSLPWPRGPDLKAWLCALQSWP